MIVSGEILPTNEIQVRVGVEEALNQYLAAWDLVFEAMWKDGAQAGRESAARRHGFDIDFSITRPEVDEALEENAERAGEQVQERMTGDIVDAVLDAHDRGLDIEEIAQELSNDVFPDMKTWQARRVAQTCVISASNKGNLTAYKSASGVTGKKWLATDDHRVRESHEDIDGQERELGEPFETGNGNEAMFPGDPSLPASDRINCRCAVSPSIDI